jgi:hypothetical protein
LYRSNKIKAKEKKRKGEERRGGKKATKARPPFQT